MPTPLGLQQTSLCDVLDRVLNTGVVVTGDLVITVADIELVYVGVHLTLCSVETAREYSSKAAGPPAAQVLP